MHSLKYPFDQLMEIKQNRFDRAVKVLEEKKTVLKRETEQLEVVTKERDETAEHKQLKLSQLRAALDEGAPFSKIDPIKVYMKVVDEELEIKKKKVEDQKKKVDTAQEEVTIATEEVFQRKKDVEKLELHKEEWEKEVSYFMERAEGVEQDEQGSAAFLLRQREKALRKKQQEKNENP